MFENLFPKKMLFNIGWQPNPTQTELGFRREAKSGARLSISI